MIRTVVAQSLEPEVWRAPTDLSLAAQERLTASLSPKEWEHAARLRADRDRSRFLSCRGWLRQLLAGYLETDPREIEFVPGLHGKPALARPAGTDLRFNVAQSGGLALIAVAQHLEVGVDLEQVRPDFPVDAVARRFFTALEQARLEGLSGPGRLAAFFEVWTRKEAYLKGVGVGVGDGGLQIDTTHLEHVSPGPWSREQSLGGVMDWSVGSVDAGPDYAAAVAVHAPGRLLPAIAQPLWPAGS